MGIVDDPHPRLSMIRTYRICIVFISMLWATQSFGQRVVINEIMYAPTSPESEWIELYSADSVAHDLTGWHVATLSKSALIPSAAISARGFVVITKDSIQLRLVRPGNYPIVQAA